MDKIGCINNTIITSSGIYFDYANPKPEQITIHDIAKALSNTSRFGGHSHFYSVAEHSVHCATLANNYAYNDKVIFSALMHDASEAYIGDMPKPLKLMMPEFQKLESKVEAVINSLFNIDDDVKEIIKMLDLEMLKAEKHFLFPKDKQFWPGFDKIDDVDIDIKCWSPINAEIKFLELFEDIYHG